MPDITMCNSTACPIRNQCYRSEASGTTPDEYQSWAAFAWRGCQAFIDVTNKGRYAKNRHSKHLRTGAL